MCVTRTPTNLHDAGHENDGASRDPGAMSRRGHGRGRAILQRV